MTGYLLIILSYDQFILQFKNSICIATPERHPKCIGFSYEKILGFVELRQGKAQIIKHEGLIQAIERFNLSLQSLDVL